MAKTIAELRAEQDRIANEIEQALAAANKALRGKIDKLLAEAESTIQEVYPELGKAKAKATGGSRKVGIPRYIANNKPMDGRTAGSAAMASVFDKVKVNGKIDDTKAYAAGLINPEWFKTQSEADQKKIAAA